MSSRTVPCSRSWWVIQISYQHVWLTNCIHKWWCWWWICIKGQLVRTLLEGMCNLQVKAAYKSYWQLRTQIEETMATMMDGKWSLLTMELRYQNECRVLFTLFVAVGYLDPSLHNSSSQWLTPLTPQRYWIPFFSQTNIKCFLFFYVVIFGLIWFIFVKLAMGLWFGRSKVYKRNWRESKHNSS